MDKGTKARTIALIIALANQLLTSTGLNPVPGSYEIWYEVATVGSTIAASVICWFRNNYVTAVGRRQRKVLKQNNLTK